MWGDVSDGVFMAEHGAMTWEGIVEQREYYRLFTSTFLHFWYGSSGTEYVDIMVDWCPAGTDHGRLEDIYCCIVVQE